MNDMVMQRFLLLFVQIIRSAWSLDVILLFSIFPTLG